MFVIVACPPCTIVSLDKSVLGINFFVHIFDLACTYLSGEGSVQLAGRCCSRHIYDDCRLISMHNAESWLVRAGCFLSSSLLSGLYSFYLLFHLADAFVPGTEHGYDSCCALHTNNVVFNSLRQSFPHCHQPVMVSKASNL